MMDDIVERMRCRTLMQYRGHGDARDVPDEDCNEAADEIERLRAENARLRKALIRIESLADEMTRKQESYAGSFIKSIAHAELAQQGGK